MIFIELMTAENGTVFWLNPDAIDEITPVQYGNTMIRLKTGRTWTVRNKPSDILDKCRKAREDEQTKVEIEGT